MDGYRWQLILPCQILRKLVILAGKRASRAMDGMFHAIPGAWIPTLHAGMTIFEKGIIGSDKAELIKIIIL